MAKELMKKEIREEEEEEGTEGGDLELEEQTPKG